MSTSAAALPAEAKARIIKHMNADHQDSLVLYLEKYAGLSAWTAQKAHLVDVSLAAMTISTSPDLSASSASTASGQLHTVPFTPALSSAAELRPRVVAMDQESRKALGRSDITVKRFVPPQGVAAVFALFAFWTLVNTTRPENFLPGSFLYDNLYKYVPAWAELNYKLANYVWYAIVVLHGIEAIFVMAPKLRKHNVAFGSATWFKWAVSHFFFDGIATILRFDKHVKQEQAKRDEKKH